MGTLSMVLLPHASSHINARTFNEAITFHFIFIGNFLVSFAEVSAPGKVAIEKDLSLVSTQIL